MYKIYSLFFWFCCCMRLLNIFVVDLFCSLVQMGFLERKESIDSYAFFLKKRGSFRTNLILVHLFSFFPPLIGLQ